MSMLVFRYDHLSPPSPSRTRFLIVNLLVIARVGIYLVPAFRIRSPASRIWSSVSWVRSPMSPLVDSISFIRLGFDLLALSSPWSPRSVVDSIWLVSGGCDLVPTSLIRSVGFLSWCERQQSKKQHKRAWAALTISLLLTMRVISPWGAQCATK